MSYDEIYRYIAPANYLVDEKRISSAAFKNSAGVSVDEEMGRPLKDCVDRLRNAMADFDGRVACVESASQDPTCSVHVHYTPLAENEFHRDFADNPQTPSLKSKAMAKCLAAAAALVS